jgi:very-short-patch-repair endonuclease
VYSSRKSEGVERPFSPQLSRPQGGERARKRRPKVLETSKTSVARRLRQNATTAVQRLWGRLRSRSLYRAKFVRQEPIGPYTVDVVCRQHGLVEVDGGQHSENKLDVVRDRWLREHGYCVLRFWNNDVIGNIEGVLEAIASALPGALSLVGEGRGEGRAPQAQSRQTQIRGTHPSARPSLPPKSGLPDFGTLIEIDNRRFRLRGEGGRCGQR